MKVIRNKGEDMSDVPNDWGKDKNNTLLAVNDVVEEKQ